MFGNCLRFFVTAVPLLLPLGFSGAVLLTYGTQPCQWCGLVGSVFTSIGPEVILDTSAPVFWVPLGINTGLFTIMMPQVAFIVGNFRPDQVLFRLAGVAIDFDRCGFRGMRSACVSS